MQKTLLNKLIVTLKSNIVLILPAICSVTNPETNADDLGKPSIWKGRLDGLKDPVLIANRDQ